MVSKGHKYLNKHAAFNFRLVLSTYNILLPTDIKALQLKNVGMSIDLSLYSNSIIKT